MRLLYVQFSVTKLLLLYFVICTGLVYADDSLESFAKEFNDRSAQYILGIRYLRGSSVKKNKARAIEYLQLAAKQGHAKAQYELGKIYLKSEKGSKHHVKAVHLLTKSAKQGIRKAQYELGRHFTVEKNFKFAIKWYGLAAQQDDERAQFNLGKMYIEGLGGPKDIKKGETWIRRSADAGLKAAITYLEKINKAKVVPKQTKKPLPKRIEKKPRSIAKKTLPTVATLTQEKSPVDPLILAAKKGDAVAQYQLGLRYLSDSLRSVNTKEALDWLSKAAENHYTEAQYTLGKLYLRGEVVKKNYFLAAEWLTHAAQKGDAESQYLLANMYHKGLGLKKNTSAAIKWYRSAAKRGHKKAQDRLGGCQIC